MAKTEQTHRPIGSVGSDRLDQSEESCEQTQRPIRSVGSNCLDQSEESCEQAQRPIRSVGRTIASTNQKRRVNKRRTNHKRRAKRRTNQKRRANKCIDQSGALGKQLPRPIRRVSQSREEAEKAPLNQSDFVWQGALADASSRQKDGLSSG